MNVIASAISPKSLGSSSRARTAVVMNDARRTPTNEPYAQNIPRSVRVPILWEAVLAMVILSGAIRSAPGERACP